MLLHSFIQYSWQLYISTINNKNQVYFVKENSWGGGVGEVAGREGDGDQWNSKEGLETGPRKYSRKWQGDQ